VVGIVKAMRLKEKMERIEQKQPVPREKPFNKELYKVYLQDLI
jgi:hypothetical protein